MMKPITQNVGMMVEIAADHALIQTIVYNAIVLVILLAKECQMPFLEMVTVMMK